LKTKIKAHHVAVTVLVIVGVVWYLRKKGKI
jgi:hypothetical protein